MVQAASCRLGVLDASLRRAFGPQDEAEARVHTPYSKSVRSLARRVERLPQADGQILNELPGCAS